MTEIWTNDMSMEDVKQIVASASKLPGFVVYGKSTGMIYLAGESLPSLAGHECTNERMGIGMKHGRAGTMSEDVKKLFRDLADSLRDRCVVTVARLDIAESGRPYDYEEWPDVMLLYGRDYLGPMMKLDHGKISPASEDPAYRVELFRRVFDAVGLTGKVEVNVVDGRVEVVVRGESVLNRGDLTDREIPPLLEVGHRIVDVNETDYLGSCAPILYFPTMRAAADAGEAVIERLGADKVLHWEYSLNCRPEAYEAVRSYLNGTSARGWKVWFPGRTLFSVLELDQAVAQLDGFTFRGFSFKEPKVGTIGVDVLYGDGTFRLTFVTEKETDKVIAQLEKRIIELAGGRDVIDPDSNVIV